MKLIIEDPVSGKYVLEGEKVSYLGTGLVLWDDSKQGPAPKELEDSARADMKTRNDAFENSVKAKYEARRNRIEALRALKGRALTAAELQQLAQAIIHELLGE